MGDTMNRSADKATTEGLVLRVKRVRTRLATNVRTGGGGAGGCCRIGTLIITDPQVAPSNSNCKSQCP